jgi:hypothetical protein
MCHGYEMRWWKSETAAKRETKKADPDISRTVPPRQKEKVETVSAEKVVEKELIPAE